MKKNFIILAICVLKLCALTDNTSKNFTDFLTQKDSYVHSDEKSIMTVLLNIAKKNMMKLLKFGAIFAMIEI